MLISEIPNAGSSGRSASEQRSACSKGAYPAKHKSLQVKARFVSLLPLSGGTRGPIPGWAKQRCREKAGGGRRAGGTQNGNVEN